MVDYTETLRDAVYGECGIEKTTGVWVGLTDSCVTSDYVRRDPLKACQDSGVSSDVILKVVDKTFRDVSTCVDSVAKDVIRIFLFESPVTGYSSLGVSKKLVEEVDVSDWLTKTLKKFVDIFESCIVSDRVAKDTMRVFTDSSVGEFLVSKGFGTIKTEVINVSDYMMRDISKPFFEVLTVSDLLYKGMVKMLVDQVFDTGRLVKLTAKSVTDKVAMKEISTKIAYKLTGLDVRRVYWLGGDYWVWRDIIEPEDHNVRIEVAKILLERMKQLKEELE